MEAVLTQQTVSITELKRNFSAVLSCTDTDAVAILNHNRPEAYLLSAAHYEQLMQIIEDAEDRIKVLERSSGPFVKVSLDEL